MLSTVTLLRSMDVLPQIAERAVRPRVLIVDGDVAARSACIDIARSLGYSADGIASLGSVVTNLHRSPTDIVLVDLPRNSSSGLEILAEIKALYPRISIIAMAPVNSASMALAAVHSGASDYLNRPFTVDELASSLERAQGQVHAHQRSRQLLERLRLSDGMGQLIGRSPQMEKLYRICRKWRKAPIPF